MKNMNHISENDNLKLPKNTYFIDTNIDHQLLEEKIIDILRSN